ncbi:MAG: RnfABCDGE type electron transport complex subunit D [Tissierellia bacterium]|jgi:electron transport complex protein RnfD|nr:RnfABCDGE type electron transport complex subunit D [Tissierellia bacterium]MDD3227199.1 RnfABCDGE type electron transport complex subunit D [Tissierellia bacterium]MDD3751408.1 RnfABCDGE type electron transport complex subunit D [Tissierellia bacterium]MDD4046821.1 RnfABCDGE type electron transport complex subunit D [Tissierellia bacterium]MDD4678791.1 RnfABCDGE type electron transport complex subunit D [Tissierellia bacterium]
MEIKLIGSSSPHIRSDETTQKIMLDVIIALMPALAASMYYFGFKAMVLVLASVISAVVTEYCCQRFMNRPITVTDLSAVVTGILLAFNLPAETPWWIAIVGSAFAIGIVKQVFGGLGFNFLNPALAARAFLMASWPHYLSGGFIDPAVDAVSSATPLALLKGTASGQLPSLWDMFMGNIPGVIGETSAILLLAGGIYLIYRGTIKWIIPVFYIGTVAVIALITDASTLPYHILGGGLILGAFFMATDYSTSPVTDKGKVIFAVGAGLLTMFIRKMGGYPEGVSYSILLMNILTPMIDKYIKPHVFGVATGGKKNEK